MSALHLVWPGEEYLPGYVDALERGWSPDNVRPEAGREQLDRIRRDAATFLAEQVDREGKAPRVKLPDGSTVTRLPGYHRWLWDGEFCGVMGFRWQPGTAELPSYVLGHVGFSVVPWKRRRGYATRGLSLFLDDVRQEGLPWVELTTDVTNTGSRRVIEANGGALVEQFQKPAVYGGAESLRYRITL